MKQTKRRFDGEFVFDWRILSEDIRKDNPKWTEEQVERAAKDRRNFNKKHLKAYLQGYQIFHFGRNEYNIPVPFVVQATLL